MARKNTLKNTDALKKTRALLLLFSSAAIALVLYHFSDAGNLYYTVILAVFSSIIAISINKDNVVYLLRILIIIWVGLIPALAIAQGGYFAIRMPYTQTAEVAWVFSILVSTTLFSAQLGFFLADRQPYKKHSVDFARQSKAMFWVVFMLVIVAGTLISMQRGELVFFATYSSDEQGGADLPIRNLQAISGGLIIILLILVARIVGCVRLYKPSSLFRNSYFISFAFAVFYVAIWAQFLRGARMDPIGIFLALFVVSKSINGGVAKLDIRAMLLALVGLIVMQVWGTVRGMMGSDFGLNDVIRLMLERDPREVQGVAVMYFQGTFNNISVGVAGVIHALQTGLTDYWYGKSYLEFILRIPPQFVYPDRPESLAWFSKWLYGDSSGGGMNEMGEIYLNFSIYGSLFVPAIISFVIGWSYRRHISNPLNIWLSLPFIGIVCVYTRGLLYQTFDSFKAYITMLILYAMLWMVYKLFSNLGANKMSEFARIRNLGNSA